jgi:ornithine carbamoyltransferase
MMAKTKGGAALYMHPLPADISGTSCVEGEVETSVFDRYRDPMYKQASNKPYSIASMVFLQKVKNPVATLQQLWDREQPRWQS